VQVHGCFWHRHRHCALARLPKSRPDFWLPKLEANRLRDLRNEIKLANMGWRALNVWECELADVALLKDKLQRFLDA
jgi:DNA mismatch endonuclease (patch repair protein)